MTHAAPQEDADPRRRVSDRLTVGFLHVGKAESGVRRYGRILADAAKRRKDLRVIEADPGDRDATLTDVRRAARKLADADVVHLQWKVADWGGPYRSLTRLEVFLAACRRPVVVTLHDVYERDGWRERWVDGGAMALRRFSLSPAWLVVHSEEEHRRLKGMVPERQLQVIHHFVEERPPLPDRDAAKQRLGADGGRTITLLGHMTRRKGHRLVLEALPTLPEDVVAIFAGSSIEGREARGSELEAFAAELGVTDRVRFTGYVADEALDGVLAGTDIALAPFRDMSASGAVSTWISAGKPLVTSDLPAFREYDALSRGSMRMFAPYSSAALAAKLEAVLSQGVGPVDPAVQRLGKLLATPRIVARYVDVYRVAAGVGASQSSERARGG